MNEQKRYIPATALMGGGVFSLCVIAADMPGEWAPEAYVQCSEVRDGRIAGDTGQRMGNSSALVKHMCLSYKTACWNMLQVVLDVIQV